MALTKAVDTVDEWAEVAQNGIREGATKDISACYSAILHIDCCLSSAVAHTGTKVIVQISSNITGDEHWSDFMVLIGPTGTALGLTLAAQEAAGQTVLSLTNPVTNNMDNDGKFKFMEANTVANSEIVYQIANSGDAGDTITILDGLTSQQETTSYIWDIDNATAEALLMWTIELPMAANRCRVIYNNKYDPDGATVHTHCRLSKVTAV